MKYVHISKLMRKIEGKALLSDKFHRDSSIGRSAFKKTTNQVPLSWRKINFKTYPRFDRIILKKNNRQKNNLGEIIKRRKSVRQFTGLPISREEFSHLLLLSSGFTHLDKTFDESKRSYPSAGARYPLEVYPIILNCKGIGRGLYHYNVKESSLELLLKENLKKWIVDVVGGENWIAEASAVFIITGVLDRSRVKYGDRGYRFVLIEAGHLSQNILLLATELGLGSCPLGGFIDSEVNNLLDINLQKEVALYMIAVGKL